MASLWLECLSSVRRSGVRKEHRTGEGLPVWMMDGETTGRRLTRKTQSRHWARSGQLCPPSEDLEDLEQSGKAFKSGEEKAGSIKLIGRADTLPTEGFYD